MRWKVDNHLNNAERVRRYRERQRALGLCIRCPQPASSGPECDYHRARNSAQSRLNRRYGLPAPLVRELGLDTAPNTDRRLNADR